MPSAITTAEDLLKAGDIGRCELVRGRLIMMVPAEADHGRIAIEVGYRLAAFVKSRKLGTVFATETGFLLSRDPDTVRAPGAAFVRKGRAPTPSRGYYPGAPDLAVEVVSQEDCPGEVREKVEEWLGAGARAVWVVDPETRTVAVHEPGRAARVIGEASAEAGCCAASSCPSARSSGRSSGESSTDPVAPRGQNRRPRGLARGTARPPGLRQRPASSRRAGARYPRRCSLRTSRSSRA